MVKYLTYLITLLIMTALATPIVTTSSGKQYIYLSNYGVKGECREYYFIDLVYFRNSSIDLNVTLDIPINLSLGSIKQESHVVIGANESNGKLRISPSTRNLLTYLITYVKVCYPDHTWALGQILSLTREPTLYGSYSVPHDLISKYVGKAEPIIYDVVRKDFIEFLSGRSYSINNLSKAGLATYAATFIYLYYIKYTPSAIPHNVTETIKTGRGDCDDMSRVLTELLWSYGIPALIGEGYVVLKVKKPLVSRYGLVTRDLTNLGPHAFVIAYLPGIGWSSIDLLASSLLFYPFIFLNVTNDTSVPRGIAKEFNRVMRSIDAYEVVLAIPTKYVDEVSKVMELPNYLILDALAKYIYYLLNSSPPSLKDAEEFLKTLATENYYASLSKLTQLTNIKFIKKTLRWR